MLAAISDNVIILPDEQEEEYNGIIIPDCSKHNFDLHRGTVVAVGPGKLNKKGERIPIDNVKVGDRIIYNSFSQTWIEHEGKSYLGMHAESIFAIIT